MGGFVERGVEGAGEIVASMRLENTSDRANARAGLRDEATVRRTTVEGTVDTGAILPMLPENIVSRLGLRTQSEAIVMYGDERKETRRVAGPLTLQIGNRSMTTECIVGPPLSQPLIGHVVLSALDLVADCSQRTLGPRPGSPDLPLIKMK